MVLQPACCSAAAPLDAVRCQCVPVVIRERDESLVHEKLTPPMCSKSIQSTMPLHSPPTVTTASQVPCKTEALQSAEHNKHEHNRATYLEHPGQCL